MRPLRRAQSPDPLSPPGSPRSLAARLAALVAGVLLVAALAVGFAPSSANAQEDVYFGVDIRSCPSAAYPAAIGTFSAASCLREPTFNVSRSYDIAFDDGAFVYTYDIEVGEAGFGIVLPVATYTVTVSDDVSGATASTTVTFPADGSGGILFTEYYALGSLPAANDDAYSVDEDQTLTVPAPGVLGNDQYLVGGETVSIIDGPYNGTATLSANGSLSYTPTPDFNGEDTIYYSLLTGAGLPISEAVITITVNAIPEAFPVAVDDFYSVDEDTVLTIEAPGLLENDSVPGGNPFPYAIDDISDGMLVEGFDGSFTYTPSPNFVGTTTFPYQVDDADGQTSNVATVTITVNDVNEELPVAVDDSYSVDEDTVLTIGAPGVLGNDTVTDDGTTAFVVGDVSSGTLELALDGSLVYTPAANFFGDATVPYRIEDKFGQISDVATVTITVNAVNDAPVANPDSYTTNEDTPLLIAGAPLANDSDVEGSALRISIVDVPTNGTLSLDLNGDDTYTPRANFNGTDSFSYRARDDADALSALVTVTINVSAVNDPPVGVADSYTVAEDGQLNNPSPNLLANDFDADDSAGSLQTTPVQRNTDHGTVVVNAFGNFIYTPTPNYNGPDSFQYVVRDLARATSAPTTVTIDVTAVNDPPTIADVTDVTTEAAGPLGATVTYTAPAASDVEDGVLTATCVPTSGTVFPVAATTVTCTATDASGATATSDFTVTVVDTADPVITVPTEPITVEATGPTGAPVTFTVTATDTVDTSVTVTCDPVSGGTFPLGETTVDCTATDDSGNTAEGNFTVEVVDTTDPVITVPTEPITVEATGPGGEVVRFTATVTDLVDTDVAVTCLPASGSTFPVGDTTVTCTATDDSGNTAEGTFTVTVSDTTPPVIIVPDDITAEATSPAGATVPFTVTATDLVDGNVTVVCRIGETVITSPYAFPKGTRTVTCTATDDSGNPATATFTVTVRDTTGPSIRWIGGPVPGGIYTTANLPAAPTCEGTDLASEVTQCRVYGYQSGPGFWTLTARARDAEGNSAVATRTYRVVGSGPGVTPPASPTPRPTGTPTVAPTQPPTQPTATPTRPPRTTPALVQPTATPVPPTAPPVQPTTAPTRPPRR